MCFQPVLSSYGVIASSSAAVNSQCAVETIKALSNPIFFNNPLDLCRRKLFRIPCSDHGDCGQYDEGLCLEDGWCSLSCASASDCLSGVCRNVTGISTCLLYTETQPSAESNNSLVQVTSKCMQTSSNLLTKSV